MYIRTETKTREFTRKIRSGGTCVCLINKKIYILKCDSCGNEFQRNKGTMSAKRLNNQYKHFCPKCFNYGLITLLGRESYHHTLENKIGTKSIDSVGYVTVYIGTHHPFARYCGSIREHILVMQKHLGRQLKKGEVVHHIDGNKTNNELSNLDLCTVQEHNACHGKTKDLIFKLFNMGIVGYNKVMKSYFIKENH